MKKKILLIFMLMGGICGFSQTKLLEEGKTWRIREFAPFVQDNIYEYTVKGDTILNDTTSVKICSTYDDKAYFFVHEENGKIWLYMNWNGPARYQLVIDFNLGLGVPHDYYVDVLDEKVMEVEGVSRRVLSVAYPGLIGPHSYWIEGVGITTSDIYLSSVPFPMGYSQELLSCYLNGECLYLKENFDLQTGVESVAIDTDEDAPIYNLQGMRVTSPRKGCAYIKNGKKMVW